MHQCLRTEKIITLVKNCPSQLLRSDTQVTKYRTLLKYSHPSQWLNNVERQRYQNWPLRWPGFHVLPAGSLVNSAICENVTKSGWPRHRENREFGSYFFQTGKTQGILLQHRESFWDTGKIFLTVFTNAKSMFIFTYFQKILALLCSA